MLRHCLWITFYCASSRLHICATIVTQHISYFITIFLRGKQNTYITYITYITVQISQFKRSIQTNNNNREKSSFFITNYMSNSM